METEQRKKLGVYGAPPLSGLQITMTCPRLLLLPLKTEQPSFKDSLEDTESKGTLP